MTFFFLCHFIAGVGYRESLHASVAHPEHVCIRCGVAQRKCWCQWKSYKGIPECYTSLVLPNSPAVVFSRVLASPTWSGSTSRAWSAHSYRPGIFNNVPCSRPWRWTQGWSDGAAGGAGEQGRLRLARVALGETNPELHTILWYMNIHLNTKIVLVNCKCVHTVNIIWRYFCIVPIFKRHFEWFLNKILSYLHSFPFCSYNKLHSSKETTHGCGGLQEH